MLMAVFLLNNCKFQGCGRAFTSLADLIHHIEDSHIDGDPKALERQEVQQPSSLALSYILKHYTKGSGPIPIKKEAFEISSGRKKIRAQSPAISIRSSTPTGSELGDDEDMSCDDEDSDDSYTTQEEFTTELILGMMQNLKDGDVDKPFACPVPGCKKRYKNVNGMKYHARHGHRKETSLCCRVKKAFKCKCGKSYRTAQALRTHMIVNHSTTDLLKQQPQVSPLALNNNTSVGNKSPTQTSPITSSSIMTNAVFSVPPTVTNSELTQSNLSLVPVTMTTTKQGQITLTNPATFQLISCPATDLISSEQTIAK